MPDALGRPAVRRVDTLVPRANGWRKKSGLRRRTFAFYWRVGETTTLLETGSASGSMDAAKILKPALARGAIRVIGATTSWNCCGASMSAADFHVKAGCRGRSGKSPAVIQLETTLRDDDVWISNPDLEDKAGAKQRVKGIYKLPTNKFRVKIRNIAGDEIVIDSSVPR